MYRTNMNGMRRRVTRRMVAASSSGMGSLTQVLHLAVTEAGDEVVVHHAHRLHERIADGRSDEAEAALRQGVAHRVGFTGARREVAEGAAAILFGSPAHEAPEKHAERPVPRVPRVPGTGRGGQRVSLELRGRGSQTKSPPLPPRPPGAHP